MVLKPNDYFKVLGLSRNASIKDIKTAYFKLAREWHPDYNKTPDAVRKFRLITEAYEVLKDNDKRTEYILRNHDIGRDYEYVNSNRNNQTKSEWSDYTSEEKQRYKENYDFRMRSLLFFERLIHPRTLIILIPLYLFGNLIYCSFYPVESNVKRYSKGRDDEMIDAWFNSKSNRWETAAPNNPEYIKSVKNGEIKRKHWKEVYRSK